MDLLVLEGPAITADLHLVDAEIAAMDTPGCPVAGHRVRVARRSARRAYAVVRLAMLAALATALVNAPLDYGEGRSTA